MMNRVTNLATHMASNVLTAIPPILSGSAEFPVHSLQMPPQWESSLNVVTVKHTFDISLCDWQAEKDTSTKFLSACFLRFFHIRLGELLACSCFCPYVYGCYSEAGEQHNSFGFYPVTHIIIYVGESPRQVFLLGFEYLLQAFRLRTVYTLWTLPLPYECWF